MIKSCFLIFVIVLSLLSLSLARYMATPADYGTGNVNFEWNYLNYFGDRAGSTTNILDTPTNFIITSDGNSIIIVDEGTRSAKSFAQNNFTSFTFFPDQSLLPNSTRTVYAIEQIGSNSYIITSVPNFILFNAGNVISITPSPTARFPSGLAFDGSSILYVADYTSGRVLAYSISLNTNATPLLRLYGKTVSNDTTTPRVPSASNLGSPYQLQIDCSGNLWITDLGFNRILRYPNGSTTPDLVWGQPDFVSNDPTSTQNGFAVPYDLIFNNDCSVAFVADGARVLRFRAPFTSNQGAEAVLGAGNFTTEGTFGRLRKLQLRENVGDNSGVLYMCDDLTSRVLVGNTRWGPAATPSPSVSPVGTTGAATNLKSWLFVFDTIFN